MADHNDPPSTVPPSRSEVRAQIRRTMRHYMTRPNASIAELERMVRQELEAIDSAKSLLTEQEQDALLKCPAKTGGETMERLVILGLIEHRECVGFHKTFEFVNYASVSATKTPSQRTLHLANVRSLRELATYAYMPFKIATSGGKGSDIFYVTNVDIHKPHVSFMLVECKFGTTPLDNGRRGRLANGDKNSTSTNRVMREILGSLRATAVAIRDAIVAALRLDSNRRCSFELVLACGSPINEPAYKALVSDRRKYPVYLWYHDYLWANVWEERVKAFLLDYYKRDAKRARFLHKAYKFDKAVEGSKLAAAYSNDPSSVLLDTDASDADDAESSKSDSASSLRRGWDADLLIIDEAGWIKQPRVFKTAFPVATQKRSACVMLTTPGPVHSYFMRLLKQVDANGQPKLVILRFGTPCDDCLKGESPWLCRHKDEAIPWIDRDKQDELAYLYLGDEKFRGQETMALEVNNVIYMFQPFVPIFRSLELFATIEAPSVLYCHIDMAFGGDCEASIIIGYYPDWSTTRNIPVIVYGDSFKVPNNDLTRRTHRLRQAIENVRANHFFRDAHIRFAPEDAPPGTGPQLYNDLRPLVHNFSAVELSGKDGNRRIGVPITQETKADQSRRMQMIMSQNNLRYSNFMRTYESPDKSQEVALREFKAKLEQQLENWREEPYQTGDINEPMRYRYGGKSSGTSDDVAKAVLDLGYWPLVDAAHNKRRR